jgi:hypothetical protein
MGSLSLYSSPPLGEYGRSADMGVTGLPDGVALSVIPPGVECAVMNKHGFIGGFGPLVGVTAGSPTLGWVDTDSDWLFLYWGIWSAAFKERHVMSGG